MGMTIREKADTVGCLRYVSVVAMETLARWIPTTAELEAKICFGRHVWEFAQHADALGKRTAELRAALHFSNPPVKGYAAMLSELAAASSTRDRIALFYEGLLPDLERRYRAYLDHTDHLLDDPSVRLMERALADVTRIRSEAGALVRERPELAGVPSTVRAWAERAGAIAEWVTHRAPAAAEGLA